MIKNKEERNINIGVGNLYDTDLIEKIYFDENNQIVISEDIEKILLEYFYEDILKTVVTEYSNSQKKVISNYSLIDIKKSLENLQKNKNISEDDKVEKIKYYKEKFDIQVNNNNKQIKYFINKLNLFISENVIDLYYDFMEKILKVNIIEFTNNYSEYRIFEDKAEVISIIFFNIFNVSRSGELSKEDRKKLKKQIKKMKSYLMKKLNQKFEIKEFLC